MSFGTNIYTWIYGNLVGQDEYRNKYYCNSKDFKDIESDYFNYLDYKGTEDEDAWRIFLNRKTFNKACSHGNTLSST